jgi:hypothetical protein
MSLFVAFYVVFKRRQHAATQRVSIPMSFDTGIMRGFHDAVVPGRRRPFNPRRSTRGVQSAMLANRRVRCMRLDANVDSAAAIT